MGNKENKSSLRDQNPKERSVNYYYISLLVSDYFKRKTYDNLFLIFKNLNKQNLEKDDLLKLLEYINSGNKLKEASEAEKKIFIHNLKFISEKTNDFFPVTPEDLTAFYFKYGKMKSVFCLTGGMSEGVLFK